MNPVCKTVVIWALLMASAGTTVAEEPLNLLFFGNSFSFGADVPGRVATLARADAHAVPVVVKDVPGGTDLDYHIAEVADAPELNITNSALPAGETFDFVIMQGYSTEATATLGDGTFSEDALTLYRAVKNHPSGNGAEVSGVLYQTWAYPYMLGMGPYPSLTAAQAEVVTGYQAACDYIEAAEGAGTCRIGTVGQAFELGGFDDSFYHSDERHASYKGAMLAAMVLYRTIYNEDVSDISYISATVAGFTDISPAEWVELAELADAAPIMAPEPATMSLLGLGAMALLRRRRRKG